MGEPVGASLIAWLVLGEAVTGEVAAGSAIILVAVVTALWRPRPALLVEEDG